MAEMHDVNVEQFRNVNDINIENEYKQQQQQQQLWSRATRYCLPHHSLLDIYDKQQQQCQSAALLPTINVDVVARRHSSHYYPMLETICQKPAIKHEQQQQQQQQNQTRYFELASLNCLSATPHRNSDGNAHFRTSSMMTTPTPTPTAAAVATSTTITTNNLNAFNNKMLPIPATTAAISNTFDTALNSLAIDHRAEGLLSLPPPVPRRTFQGAFTNRSEFVTATTTITATTMCSTLTNAGNIAAADTDITPRTPYSLATSSEYRKQLLINNQVLQYYRSKIQLDRQLDISSSTPPSPAPEPQQLHKNTSIETGNSQFLFDATIEETLPSSIVNEDCISPRMLFMAEDAVSSYDADAISDDDHMSLENSVFEESLNCTPIKVPAGAVENTGKLFNGSLSTKTVVALATELNNTAKHSNRSSCSTMDSSFTSSGYGSHSERLTSSSTNADYRSRLSSEDTQYSIDSNCLMERIPNVSSILKDPYETERSLIKVKDVMTTSLLNSHEGFANIENDDLQTKDYTRSTDLPVVPMRTNLKNDSTCEQVHSSCTAKKNLQLSLIKFTTANSDTNVNSTTNSTVTSSTSTASAASSTSSGSLISSISISGNSSSPSQNPSSGQLHSKLASRRAAVPPPPPPIPPARLQNQENNKRNKSGTQPTLTVRNKLKKTNTSPTSMQQETKAAASKEPRNLMGNTVTRANNKNIAVEHGIEPKKDHQDSIVSSDSFSQNSSPDFNSKNMEAPLLPLASIKHLCKVASPIKVRKQKTHFDTIDELNCPVVPISPLTKCVSTPASLQTIVRFQNGAPNTMSLSNHITSHGKHSNSYILTNERLKFRLLQLLINALALIAIAGGLAAYFNAYPTIKFINKTVINTIHVEELSVYGKNPAPGTCLPIIVKFCQGPQIPYNFTVFPNYIGHFGQLETQVDLDAYEALVDVRCYELVSLFLCTLFVPKCGPTGATVPPCKSLCTETIRRCGFFFDVFGLSLPEYLNCKLFKDFENSDECVGFEEVQDVMLASVKPTCKGFQCDHKRCIPEEYVCDGHLDCMDQMDESDCQQCAKDEIYCGQNSCVSSQHICDGVMDCPYGQDERNCIRLSERNGDLGTGVLEVYRMSLHEWTPACVKVWDRAVSPMAVCSLLGYSSVNATSVVTRKTHRPLLTSVNVSDDIWKMFGRKKSNLMKELTSCHPDEDYPIADLTCSNFECGKIKMNRHSPTRRIVGGSRSSPGTWPFLAAILGGPEKIFYCAGVLISDQWVLTASHCIGNHTVIDLEDWTIQLGITRRNSFTYSSQRFKVKTVISHPQYNMAVAHDNDIALFQLASRVSFHEHLLPVCLPPANIKFLKADTMCTVVGWGKRQDKNPKATYEDIVNEVQVPIIKRQICDEWLDNLTISDGMICAGYKQGGKDACQGDSGGPLLCPYPDETNRWFVGGIVSWGIMCAHPKLPGVYANVIKYVPWIQEQIQKYSKLANERTYSKYDNHPGGPNMLSNILSIPVKRIKSSHKP